MDAEQGMQEQVAAVVRAVLDEKRAVGGVEHVVWIGAGGSNGGSYPAQYFMEHEARAVSSHMVTSNEFVYDTPAYVGSTTLAVAVSMRGTPETIEAARVARERGAATVAVYVDESGLTEACDHRLRYHSLAIDESDMGRTNSAVVLRIAVELLRQTEGYAAYGDALQAFGAVEPLYRAAFARCQEPAAAWAEQNADRPTVNVLASGPLNGAAYVFAICNIQEMLQIDAVTTNACDFFHGPFEVLDENTSVFQLVGLGSCRAADERATRFLGRYGGERVYRLDAEEIGLAALPASVAPYFEHLVISPLLNNVYMRALSAVTGKDYLTRRYMWQVPY